MFTLILLGPISAMIEEIDSNRVDYCFNALPAQFYHDKVKEFCEKILNPITENKNLAINYIRELYKTCKSLISIDQVTQKMSFTHYAKAKLVYEKYLISSNIPSMLEQRERHSPCHDVEEVSDISGIGMKSGFRKFYQDIACHVAIAVADLSYLSIRASVISSSEDEEESSLQHKQYIEKLRSLQDCVFQAKLQEFNPQDIWALNILQTQRFLAMVQSAL